MTRNDSLSRPDFENLRRLVYQEAGIHLTPEKRTMVEIRLKRRMRALAIGSYTGYCDYLLSPEGRKDELVHFIDVITTNKTDFFREPAHYDCLVSQVLPDLASRYGEARRCLVWSAGCSTGEEPYTLAMILYEHAAACPGFRFDILATDISTEVLQKAEIGIFKTETIRPIPLALRNKYLLRSRDPDADQIRIAPQLRQRVSFRRLNFMDNDFALEEAPEIIFCRNVIIYFDRATQIQLLQRMTRLLRPGGYFFAGHSESLQGMNLPLVPIAPAVYHKC